MSVSLTTITLKISIGGSHERNLGILKTNILNGMTILIAFKISCIIDILEY